MHDLKLNRFNSAHFMKLLEAQFGLNTFPAYACSVKPDFQNPQFIEDGIKARIPMMFYSPFLSQEIADYLGFDKVRIGCDFYLKFLLFHYNFKPTFSALSQELDGFNYGNDLFFELHQGYSVKRVQITSIELEDDENRSKICEILSRIYMPFLLLNFKIHEYRTLENEFSFGYKTVHKQSVLNQLNEKIGKQQYKAVLQDRDGTRISTMVMAHSMQNALDILAYQYEHSEVLEIKQVLLKVLDNVI